MAARTVRPGEEHVVDEHHGVPSTLEIESHSGRSTGRGQ
jgi:hypothetical protein